MRRVGQAISIASTKGLDHRDWLQLRARGIGGSDIGKLAGLSSWGNALSVYLDKIDPLHDDGEHSEAMAIGIAIEDFIAQQWQLRHPDLKLRRVNAVLQHPDHPWAIANVDRVVLDAKNRVVGVWEAKSGGTKDPWADEKIPEAYAVQGEWYAGILGVPRIFFAALLGGYGGLAIVEREKPADPDLFADLLQIGGHFWHLVEQRTPPAIDGSDAADAVLRRLHPLATLPPVELTGPGVPLLVGAYLDAKAAAKAADTEEKRLANEIKLLVGDHAAASCPGYVLSWPTVTTNRLDMQALGQDHPDLVAQYTKPTLSRRFTAKPEKEKTHGK